MSRHLERYLNRATRGLWGKKRLEVREELTNHIHEKAHMYRIDGFTHEAAVSRALETLGEPRVVRDGMIGVHMVPRVLQFSVLLTGFAALSFSLIPRTATAQIQINPIGPVKLCATCTSDASHRDLVWFNLRSLTDAFQKTGATVTRVGSSYHVRLDSKSFVLPTSFRQEQRDYIVDWKLYNALINTSLPLHASGWYTAQLSIGTAQLKIESQAKVVPLIFMYRNVVTEFLMSGKQESSLGFYGPRSSADTNRHRIATNKAPGTVVALVIRNESNLFTFDIAPVQSDGTVTLRGYYDKLKFVTQTEALSPYASGGRRNATLISLTGRLDRSAAIAGKTYETFTPRNLESDALK
jgi:hypothetical protein